MEFFKDEPQKQEVSHSYRKRVTATEKFQDKFQRTRGATTIEVCHDQELTSQQAAEVHVHRERERARER